MAKQIPPPPAEAAPRPGSHLADLDFHHPYTPYDVQLEFMRAVYDTLERGSVTSSTANNNNSSSSNSNSNSNSHIGILESPTGTGKSLSLICGSLTWLRNHKRRQFAAALQLDPAQVAGEPEWIIEQMLRRKERELRRKWEEREARLQAVRRREGREAEKANARERKRRKFGGEVEGGKKDEEEEEAEFLLDEWDESGGAGGRAVDDASDPLAGLSKETRALLQNVGMAGVGVDAADEEPPEDEIKIYYTSRTHSQLTQFIAELRRPRFQPSIAEDADSTKDPEQQTETVKQIPLSSRQKLCINPSVTKLGALAAINDACSELQKPKAKHKCSFLPTADNLAATHQFRDEALATLPDIEDLHRLGKTHQVCPYYASRTAIPSAEIITLPYPLLLQQNAREALGIKLEGNVVIIDEAHNIMDAVASVHAAEIRLSDLRRGRQMLGMYFKRFGKKLKGENRIMVAQVVKVIDGLAEWMTASLQNKTDNGIVEPNALMKHKGVDQINLYKLIKYIQESKLAFKVESYASHIEETDCTQSAGRAKQPLSSSSTSSPVLHSLAAFIITLTNPSDEGRIFYEKITSAPRPSSVTTTTTTSAPAAGATATAATDIKLSYLLLSPTHAFSSIATSARAVILAGGTMSPFEDYKTHLFPYLPPQSITTLSCAHVVPPSNLCVYTLTATKPKATDPSDQFEFSFQKRGDKGMIRKLGQALLNICSVVPDGVVVFFPSYGYLEQVVGVWQTVDGIGSGNGSGSQGKTLWEQLQGRKAVFRDSKAASSEETLEEYSRAILGGGDGTCDLRGSSSSKGGALLLSVVGGKMSEGINFSDRLGRCVVVVGLPYPNMNSPEWKARIEYIEASTVKRLLSSSCPTMSSMASATKTPHEAATATSTTGTTRTTTLTREQATAQAKQVARDFYENACMRAVNQSIGRAIRHRADYAAIVLVDRRFAAERIRGKLPGWIRGGMAGGGSSGGSGGGGGGGGNEGGGVQGLMGGLNLFFRARRGGAREGV
ncbi:helicase C-terminal domain-domain-containing protein [Coniella lustricola]|uniref:ATP-dependent DNA helicase CHL1 n=1 Tax=Coniella lustricola TaxID=2025994 RepID=A0A2T3A3Y7_9PEZI|nr:helicase C-terminal domain-domain-containing protein [Coniella lustricola]